NNRLSRVIPAALDVDRHPEAAASFDRHPHPEEPAKRASRRMKVTAQDEGGPRRMAAPSGPSPTDLGFTRDRHHSAQFGNSRLAMARCARASEPAPDLIRG